MTTKSSPSDLTMALIEEIFEIYKKEGWPVLTLTVGVEGSNMDRFERLFDKYHVPFIPIPSKQEQPDIYYQVDGHWNEKGHAYVADLVINRLGYLDLLPLHP